MLTFIDFSQSMDDWPFSYFENNSCLTNPNHNQRHWVCTLLLRIVI